MHTRKQSVGKVVGTIILGGLILALLIFTATRTVHFLQLSFPPDFSYIAYLALAAFDGGIIGWSIFATVASEGAMQRALAYLMIFVCLIGVILTTVADTLLTANEKGLTKAPTDIATVGIWGSLAVIILNVVAGVVAHLSAPHHIRKFQLESIHDEIHQMTIQHIRDSALEIAPHIAREKADHWVRQTIQDAVGGLPTPKQQNLLAPTRIVEAASREQVLDPHGVKPQVDNEKKKIEKKPLIDFSLPKGVSSKMTQKIDTAIADPEEEETIENGPSNDDPSKRTMADWRQYRNEVDAWTFEAAWQEEHDDLEFPDDRPAPKKRTGGKQRKNVTRREVLGMEKQED